MSHAGASAQSREVTLFEGASGSCRRGLHYGSLRYRLNRFYCFSFSEVVFDKYIFPHLTMAGKVNVREFL